MNGYLLDTCICVFLLRQRYGIAEKLNQIDCSSCYISEVTLAELKYGAYKSQRAMENLEVINNLISKINIVPFGETIDIYAKEKNRLRSIGQPVEEFDLLIGCAALSRGLTLITDNVKHFNRIKGLNIENWITR
jgi:tRNA(fMet)-specific endonuclease VapC